ncbi:MAG: class I SAM-dependent methyltransferase [Armatimonadota bacterium]|nr:class I SAM-dependent methyltransferase [Armatimonadota bacterium]
MGLIEACQLAPLLSCPRCRSRLVAGVGHYACSDQQCAFARPYGFPAVGDHPVLVDFDQSVLVEEDLRSSEGATVVGRTEWSGVGKRFRDCLFPPHAVSLRNGLRFRSLALELASRPLVLNAGGGTIGNGASAFYDQPEIDVISFDIYASSSIQFIADAHQIPLADGSVDAVWIQAVLEHVLNPWAVVSEIHRVLKKDGIVYAETPFMQQVHEGAYDFTRFTESGYRWMFRRFSRIDSGAVAGPGTQLLWTIEHISRSLSRSITVGKLMKILFFWTAYLDQLCPADFSIDGSSGNFFLGRKAETEITPADIIQHYQGAQRRRR